MAAPDSTCWTMIQGAASGHPEDRSEFAHRYLPLVRAYLQSRWARTRHVGEVDDAMQEVFVECFRLGGVLQSVADHPTHSFRAFLKGVVRNVALRHECRRTPEASASVVAEPEVEDTASRVFDREWARQVLVEATAAFEMRAARLGPEALRRVHLLRLRFDEQLPIRDIADRWQLDAAYLHHEYAKARREYRAAIENILTTQQGAVTESDFDELMQLIAPPRGR